MAKKVKLYDIKYTHAAGRDLKRLKKNRAVLKSIDITITSLRTTPRPNGAEKLSGETKYRIRDGEYRILYEIDDTDKQVLVTRVRDRKDVYKKH